MAEIKNVGAQSLPIDRNAAKIADEAAGELPNQLPQNSPEASTVGRGSLGQPVGLPLAEPTTQNALMPNVVTGRDASQLAAAEKMRANGAYSSTDVLLGLHRQPSILGILAAPPGNIEMLRHLQPASRRKILRDLLTKQREQMRRLAIVMRDEGQPHEDQSEEENQSAKSDSSEILIADLSDETALKFYNRRALRDVQATTRMLDLLDELLGMQDYTLSQMGTFSQG